MAPDARITRLQWFYWDLGFLAWGIAMLAAGWVLVRAGHAANRRINA